MTTLRDDLLSELDEIRGIPAELGLHRYQVWVRKTTWAGARPGLGAPTVTDTRLLVDGKDPHVREVRMKDVIAGDAAKTFTMFEIGPLTPAFQGGGHTDEQLSPQQTGQAVEIHYVVKGPGMPPTGGVCMRVDDTTDKPMRRMVRVKTIGKDAKPAPT